MEDAMSGSCNRGPLPTELGDVSHHCPGCLCRNMRLYCGDCMETKRATSKSRRQNMLWAAVYTVSVMVLSAGAYRHFNESCGTSKEEPLFTRWWNYILEIYR
ncbi:hypothetical protein GE061_018138 [Apolygus lucorum]|uniref:Uncharacterized protein n=1 Tax=Apolygus lucorum TaxID=248454 RepID=A0A8S9XD08_APOLU|nr:hypothetical protein GE061_018138 [Apolygus lucorum]